MSITTATTRLDSAAAPLRLGGRHTTSSSGRSRTCPLRRGFSCERSGIVSSPVSVCLGDGARRPARGSCGSDLVESALFRSDRAFSWRRAELDAPAHRVHPIRLVGLDSHHFHMSWRPRIRKLRCVASCVGQSLTLAASTSKQLASTTKQLGASVSSPVYFHDTDPPATVILLHDQKELQQDFDLTERCFAADANATRLFRSPRD
jgi:hypothetical protein